MTLDAHIVSHTHWDREWYHPLERFRQRLVALVDELLDDPPGENESFLLDGQAIVLDDYLDVRPERADELSQLLRLGRIEAGPWYVLADELIPSGEALVRNLLAGRRSLQRLGAESPPVLYCPDSFGHPAALPAIASGFGLPVIVLWRGYGGARWPAGDTVRWVAPSGDEAFVFHLPRDGYEFGSHLPLDDDGARLRWTRMRAELAPRSTTGVTLIPHGADHHARQRGFRQATEALERAAESDSVHRSSLSQFATRLVAHAGAQGLPHIRGELRDSYGYTWALQGTVATRAHEKRMNAAAERLLVREAEPWSALASRMSSRGSSQTPGSQKPLLEFAWRTLLEAHPHDTLCGCSVDDVAEAMELRIRSAINQATGVRDDSIARLIGYDAVAARDNRQHWTSIVVVRNPAPRIRSGVALIDVERFIADVNVGPASASGEPATTSVPKEKPKIPQLGPLQLLSQRVAYSRTESPRHYPDNDLVAVARVAAWVSNAPAYGLASFTVDGGRARSGGAPDRVTADKSSLRNGLLALRIATNGMVSLDHLGSQRRIETLFDLVDERDVGDLYTPAPRPRAFEIAYRGVRVVHRGPLRGELALDYRVMEAARHRVIIADITVHLTLDAGAPFVRLHIRGENRNENHRLRFVIRSDVTGGQVWADAAFGVVRREPINVTDAEAALERPPATAPLHRYVSLFDDSAGCTVFSDGLAEYEAREDGSVVVTLVRGVGELSRNDLPERPGHAGWPSPTPLAQCLGPFEAMLAFMPHGSRRADTIDAIECAADDVLNPLVGTALRSALAVPQPIEGVELVGAGLAFSAVKQSEDAEALVLRCVNLLDSDVAGEWRVPFDITTVHHARLDETVMEPVEADGRVVRFRAASRAIVTLLVR